MSGPGFVQNGPTATVTTGVCSPTITLVTDRNALIVKYSVDAINAVIAAPTDSAGQVWTVVSTFANAGGSGCIAWLKNAIAGTHTLSFATRAGAQQAGIEEVNGLVAIGGTPVSNSTTAATITSSSYTPASAGEYVSASMFEAGTTTPDNIHCNTVAFQSIGSLSDSTPHACTMINQNGTTQSGVEANAAIVTSTAAITVTWAWTGSIFCFAMVAGFTLATGSAGIVRRPGMRLGTPLSRLRSPYSDTVTGSSVGVLAAFGSSASTASVSLTATGLLAFTGSSASSAAFGLSASIAFTGSSVSTAIVPVGAGIGIVGVSASSANFAPSVNVGFSGASASAANFSLLGPAAIAFNSSSASAAFFNAAAVSAGSSFMGASASAASFDLAASVGTLVFPGSSASAAVLSASGIGLLTFNGVSASIAIVDVEPLSAGSIFFIGACASAATVTLSGPFTPPDVAPPAGALLPGVAPKTAIELERGYKYPWQATGAPIVPSPYLGSSETIQPALPAAQPLFTEASSSPEASGPATAAPTHDEAVLLMLLLGASL